MSRMKGPKRVGSLASLANILPGVCDGLKLDERINELALLALWPKQVEAIAGSHAAQNSRAVRLKKQGYQTILLARVSQSALASELGFHLPLIKEALNRFAPQTGLTVDHIQLTVGSV